MKYRYFANVMAYAEYEIEAPDQETADEMASDYLIGLGWEYFSEVGHEIGGYNPDGSWEIIESEGDI